MLSAIECVLCSQFSVLVFALVRSSVFVFVSIVRVVWLLFVFFVLHLILWAKTRSRTKNKEQQQNNDKHKKPDQSTDYQHQDQRTLSNTKTPFLETKQKHNTRTIIRNTFKVVLVLSCVWFHVLCC